MNNIDISDIAIKLIRAATKYNIPEVNNKLLLFLLAILNIPPVNVHKPGKARAKMKI